MNHAVLCISHRTGVVGGQEAESCFSGNVSAALPAKGCVLMPIQSIHPGRPGYRSIKWGAGERVSITS